MPIKSLAPKTELIERFFTNEILLTSASGLGGKPTSPGLPTSLGNPDVQILRVGKFSHPIYGDFEITKQTLAEMKANFDNKIRGIDIAFDYYHNSGEDASGWPTELYLKEDGLELWAKVDWTPKAQQKLQEREVRYFSPDFAFEWSDPESGKSYKNVLFGGGLTNRPFVKDMAAIVASETKGEFMKELEELKAQMLKLTEEHKALKEENEKLSKKLMEYAAPAAGEKPGDAANDSEPDADADDVDSLKKKLAELSAAHADLKGKHEALMAEHNKMIADKQLAEKEAKFVVLLTEGKACVAQKEAFIKGDMETFIKLAQPLNMEGKGSNANAAEGDGNRDQEALKLAEKLVKEDPKLSKLEAITKAYKQLKK